MKSSGNISIWNSLAVRFGLMFTGLVLVCILVVGYLVFEQVSKLMLEHSRTKVANDAQLAKQSFHSVLNEVSNDISVMTNNPTMLGYIGNPSSLNTQEASKLARVVLENKPEYYQLRMIYAEDGTEKLRLNKNQDIGAYETPFDQLQEKKDREYFVNAISEPNSDYYFSKINLNEEYGKVSTPHIPTLRAVGKIRNSDNRLKVPLSDIGKNGLLITTKML